MEGEMTERGAMYHRALAARIKLALGPDWLPRWSYCPPWMICEHAYQPPRGLGR